MFCVKLHWWLQLVDSVSINNGAENDFQWEAHAHRPPAHVHALPSTPPPCPRDLVRQVLIVADANKDPREALMAALKMHPVGPPMTSIMYTPPSECIREARLRGCGSQDMPEALEPGVIELVDFKKRTLFYRHTSYRDYEAGLR